MIIWFDEEAAVVCCSGFICRESRMEKCAWSCSGFPSRTTPTCLQRWLPLLALTRLLHCCFFFLLNSTCLSLRQSSDGLASAMLSVYLDSASNLPVRRCFCCCSYCCCCCSVHWHPASSRCFCSQKDHSEISQHQKHGKSKEGRVRWQLLKAVVQLHSSRLSQ